MPSPTGHYNVLYTGDAGTTAYMDMNGYLYQVANENGSFVWDADNAQGGRHVFTFAGESITRTAGAYTFDIVWPG